jgi:hypothetical protein
MTLESLEETMPSGVIRRRVCHFDDFSILYAGTRLYALLPQLADILKTKPSGAFSWVPGGALRRATQ